jgi:hypothetical protein
MGGFIAANGVNNVWPIIFVMGISASFFMLLLGVSERRKSLKVEAEEARC